MGHGSALCAAAGLPGGQRGGKGGKRQGCALSAALAYGLRGNIMCLDRKTNSSAVNRAAFHRGLGVSPFQSSKTSVVFFFFF